jgi:hypothetical protein
MDRSPWYERAVARRTPEPDAARMDRDPWHGLRFIGGGSAGDRSTDPVDGSGASWAASEAVASGAVALGAAAPDADTVVALDAPRSPVLTDVELIGTHLRASGALATGNFTRLSDYLNHVEGFFQLSDVILLTRTGAPTRVVIPELRVRLDEIALVGQRDPDLVSTPDDHYVPKRRQRLLVMTAAHIVSGFAYLHEQASVTAFIDADDPPFIPMRDVRVRWLADRRLAGRYRFALIQRRHITGVATDVG